VLNKKLLLLLATILLVATQVVKSQSAPQQPSLSWYEAMASVKNTIVFLGTLDSKGVPSYKATGVIVAIDNVFHIVTAKHVVAEQKDGNFTGNLIDQELYAFYNLRGGGIGKRKIIDLKISLGVDWVFHTEPTVDLALLPFALNEADDLRVLPDNLFLPLSAVHELQDLFFISFQPGVPSLDAVRPVYRNGMVSVVLPDKTFFIDGAAFPGNSGSPVFIKPEPVGFPIGAAANPVYPAPNSGKFVGIVGTYIPYQEPAISPQTGRIRVLFEEHTGLSRVWSVDLIEDIVRSSKCKEQIRKMKLPRTDTGK
jgi:hypothetical protein